MTTKTTIAPYVDVTLPSGEVRRVRTLLSDGDSNTKLRKSGKSGEYLTKGLSLAPHKSSGVGNTCAHASPGCAAACLDHQGLASVFRSIRQSRAAKTVAFYRHRAWFLAKLTAEISSARDKARAQGKRLAIRLNVFSDIPWERVLPELFDAFPDVEFYDYTKNPKRVGQLRPNYWVTFSRSETNENACRQLLADAKNVTVVFAGPLPRTWNGYPVIDGDETDLRFADPRGRKHGRVVGLKLKAASNAERDGAIASGFAVKA